MERATEITKITRVADLGETAARCNRRTGELFLNMRVLRGMPKEFIVLVILHEEGHIVLPTKDEHEADAYAFKRYAELGYSLKQAVHAMTGLLNAGQPEHFLRMWETLQRAKKFDREVNGNLNI